MVGNQIKYEPAFVFSAQQKKAMSLIDTKTCSKTLAGKF